MYVPTEQYEEQLQKLQQLEALSGRVWALKAEAEEAQRVAQRSAADLQLAEQQLQQQRAELGQVGTVLL